MDKMVADAVAVLEDPAAHDLVDPLLGDVEVAELVGQVVGVAPGDEEGG